MVKKEQKKHTPEPEKSDKRYLKNTYRNNYAQSKFFCIIFDQVI